MFVVEVHSCRCQICRTIGNRWKVNFNLFVSSCHGFAHGRPSLLGNLTIHPSITTKEQRSIGWATWHEKCVVATILPLTIAWGFPSHHPKRAPGPAMPWAMPKAVVLWSFPSCLGRLRQSLRSADKECSEVEESWWSVFRSRKMWGKFEEESCVLYRRGVLNLWSVTASTYHNMSFRG